MANPLKFLVGFNLSPTPTTFSVTETSLSIPTSLGNMFSVTLNGVGISGDITKAQDETITSDYEISVQSVELGGTNARLGGAVLFPNGTPQVAELDAMDMGILDVSSRVLQFGDSGAAGSWPSAYDPFTIKIAVIYYNNGAVVTTRPSRTTRATISSPSWKRRLV